MRVAYIIAFATALGACGDDAKGGVSDTVPDAADTVTPDTVADTSVPNTKPLDATSPETADTATPETLADTTAPETVADTALETIADTTPLDTAPDTTPLDTAADVSADPATCEFESMSTTYPGPLPPFPYGTWTTATGCIAVPHDVIIVLGCPSNEDGTPSNCQIQRAIITQQLYEAGWAKHFIVSGAAVHNQYVEADALYALLVQRSLPADAIIKEPKAEHTDENIYYSTRIMQQQGWTSALVVSEDPGHLMMTALCDTNCCVNLGHMSLWEWEVEPGLTVKAGHYALIPPSAQATQDECTHISGMLMCLNAGSRKACKDNFQLSP